MTTIKQKWARERNWGLARLNSIEVSAKNLAKTFSSEKGYPKEIERHLSHALRHAHEAAKLVDQIRSYDALQKRKEKL